MPLTFLSQSLEGTAALVKLTWMQFKQTQMHSHLASLLMSIFSLVLMLILKKQQMTLLLQW